MQLPNQGPGKPDKLSQSVQAQTGHPRVQCEYALDKRGCKSPNPLTSGAPLRRTTRQAGNKLSNTQQHCRRQGEKAYCIGYSSEPGQGDNKGIQL